jgi:phthalate 4,5-dioxygenase oxygenase subunit
MDSGEDPIGVGVDVGNIAAMDAPAPVGSHWRSLVPSHRVVGIAA